jgi:hypothetical protein
LERAVIKRPVEPAQLETLVDQIVAELKAEGGTPNAERVGELALRGLRGLDRVACVRFASVYKKFEDVAEFEAELERLESEPPLQREHLFELGAARKTSSVRIESQAVELPPESAQIGSERGLDT